MPLVTAICPVCKQQIEVDSAEIVDFCKLCGKPLDVKQAIKLYTDDVAERQKQEENSRKPAQEVIDKFNAILAQDHVLAQQYLISIVKRDYPKLDISFFLTDDNYSDCFTRDYFASLPIDKFNELYSSNPYIANMYYKVLCAYVNTKYKQTFNVTFTGGLPFAKLLLANCEKCLDHIVHDINRTSEFLIREQLDKHIQWTLYAWVSFERSVKKCESVLGDEPDDAYVYYIVNRLWKVPSTSIYSFLTGQKQKCEIDDISGLRSHIRNLLSAEEKQKNEARQKKMDKELKKAQKAKEQAERELKYQQAYDEELAFWTKYIDRLKSGKTKEALALLDGKKTRRSECQGEIDKYKLVVFSWKYTGDVNSLNAEELAEKSVPYLKPINSTKTNSPKQK